MKNENSKKDEFPLKGYRLVPVELAEDNLIRENEIDLVDLAKYVWDNRSIVLKFILVGFVLGLAIALLSPKEYKSSATLMPEVQSQEGGARQLIQKHGGLLGIGGSLNLAGGGMIPPQLYPEIVQSLPFQLEVLNTEVMFLDLDRDTTVYNFFDELYKPSVLTYILEYTVGLPWKIYTWINGEEEPSPLPKGFELDSVISVTKNQMKIIDNVRERIVVSLNEETGVINISVTMPDPDVAASLTKKSIELIRQYVVNYKTQKAEGDLLYAKRQMEVAKREFEKTQNVLSVFRDRNVNLTTATSQVKLQRLESEYDLTFNVYNTLAQQVEHAKIKLQEQTPVVSILHPVQVPVEDETNGLLILVSFMILSGAISLAWLLGKKFYFN